jgi:hypothetical protein
MQAPGSPKLAELADAEIRAAESACQTPKQLMGIYHDRYVRTKDGWRIAERRGRTLFPT